MDLDTAKTILETIQEEENLKNFSIVHDGNNYAEINLKIGEYNKRFSESKDIIEFLLEIGFMSKDTATFLRLRI